MNILGVKPKRPEPVVEEKIKVEKLPTTLSCTCGKQVKVSRYRSSADYKCSTCRPKKEVVV